MPLYNKIIKIFLIVVTFLASVISISCDKGIAPYLDTVSGPTGFEGKVTFIGNWPEGILQTYLAVFKKPLKTAADFPPPNLSYVIGPISFGSTEYNYNSIKNSYSPNFTLTPGSYKYVVIVQSKKANFSLNLNDWTIVGIYYSLNDTTKPGTLTIENGKITQNINITSNFNNSPIQPQLTYLNENE